MTTWMKTSKESTWGHTALGLLMRWGNNCICHDHTEVIYSLSFSAVPTVLASGSYCYVPTVLRISRACARDFKGSLRVPMPFQCGLHLYSYLNFSSCMQAGWSTSKGIPCLGTFSATNTTLLGTWSLQVQRCSVQTPKANCYIILIRTIKMKAHL